MRRRALLATVAATGTSLAGCQIAGGDRAPGDADEPSSSDPDGDDSTGSPTEDEPGESERPDDWASVIELENVSRTYALTPTSFRTDDEAEVALWFDRTATADHPARVTGWLANGNDFENTFQIEWIPGVGRTYGRQPGGYAHESRLHFAPTGNNEIATTVPEIEQTEDGLWHVDDVGPWMPEHYRLDPGERVRLEYVLVGESGLPGRPTGTYEFRGREDEAVSVAVWDADNPGPTDSSRFLGRSVPALNDGTTVQWYHEADEASVAYVQPSTERVELDGRVRFEAINHSSETVGCGHWNLHKLVDGEWFHVGPTVHTSDCRQLHPGGRVEWSLRAFNGEAVPCNHDGSGGGFSRGYLGGGEYAAVAGYGHPADDSAALIELVGDPVKLVPTDDASAERDGDTVTVTTDRYGDGVRPPDATFVVERADEAEERLLPEQVMTMDGFGDRHGGLRNALAFFESGVERVVVRTDERGLDQATGYENERRRFELRGQAYQVTSEDDS